MTIKYETGTLAGDLVELYLWHKENANELEREQGEENALAFHRWAEQILNEAVKNV